MSDERIRVSIKGLVPTPGGSGVFLHADDKTISIFVDPMATRALSLALEGEAAPRPLTHDLMISLMGGLGVRLQEVYIHDVRDETYYARLLLEQENELGKNLLEIDARPSDGMILAAHLDVPITVASTVWEKAEDMTWALKQLQSPEDSDPESPEN
jgi:bifunctional DNase/RNase